MLIDLQVSGLPGFKHRRGRCHAAAITPRLAPSERACTPRRLPGAVTRTRRCRRAASPSAHRRPPHPPASTSRPARPRRSRARPVSAESARERRQRCTPGGQATAAALLRQRATRRGGPAPRYAAVARLWSTRAPPGIAGSATTGSASVVARRIAAVALRPAAVLAVSTPADPRSPAETAVAVAPPPGRMRPAALPTSCAAITARRSSVPSATRSSSHRQIAARSSETSVRTAKGQSRCESERHEPNTDSRLGRRQFRGRRDGGASSAPPGCSTTVGGNMSPSIAERSWRPVPRRCASSPARMPARRDVRQQDRTRGRG
jgi:hypothetical protein